MPSASRGSGRSAGETRAAIEEFLEHAREPALLEAGEELLPIGAENFALEVRGERLTLQAWNLTRNLTRRVTDAREVSAGRLELTVERFAGRQGQVFLLDLARRAGAELGKRGGRLVFRERFRLFLRRQFPQWKLAELSTEPDLAHSLSPAFPRAFLRHGQHGWAALGCAPDGDAAPALSFGLIWLDYLRKRERRLAIEGLALYLPAGRERGTALRLLALNAATARFELFTYSAEDDVQGVDPRDHGNLDTRLDHCRRPEPNHRETWDAVTALPGVERILKHDGRASLRVRGLEFAELVEGEIEFGLAERRRAHPHNLPEIAAIARELDRFRSPRADRGHALFQKFPEAWLESQVRAQIEALDATLLAEPIYGQVPAFAGGERGVIDLLAADRSGRLAVVELKASADPHLPLQALDYWVRVKWHAERGDFEPSGYFPGLALRREPPRLLLVSPALEFHPTTETILRYFSPEIEVERIGVGVEWRKGLHVMFRLSGAQQPG